MSRRQRQSGQSVSLFPFLSILACVIGTLTLMITALAQGARPAEAVDDPRRSRRWNGRGVLVQGGEQVVVRLAGVDHHWQPNHKRQVQLVPEARPLHRRGGVLVVVVQADLSDGHAAWVRCRHHQVAQVAVLHAARLVGVNAHRVVHAVVLVAQGSHPRDVVRIRADSDERGDAGLRGLTDQVPRPLLSVVEVEVAVGVDEPGRQGVALDGGHGILYHRHPPP